VNPARTVVDGSALFAILLNEPEADRCRAALQDGGQLLMSAGSLAELLIVANAKKNLSEMETMLALIQPEIIPLTATRARAAAEAYRRWGKGFDPAALNICDTFAYALAKEHNCPLLFVGQDFAKTDVVGGLVG